MSRTTICHSKLLAQSADHDLDVCRITSIFQPNYNIIYAITGMLDHGQYFLILRFNGPKLVHLVTQITTLPGHNPKITDATVEELLQKVTAKVVMFRRDEEIRRRITLYIQNLPELCQRCSQLPSCGQESWEDLDIFQPIRLHASA